jgi:hypothetical protein
VEQIRIGNKSPSENGVEPSLRGIYKNNLLNNIVIGCGKI